MPDRARALPFPLRAAVYAAAVATVLLAPEPPSTPTESASSAVARLEPPTRSPPPATPDAPAPSPVRLLLAGLLIAGVAVDAAKRRASWH